MEKEIYIPEPKPQNHLDSRIEGVKTITVCLDSIYEDKSSQRLKNYLEVEKTQNLEVGNVGLLDWVKGNYSINSQDKKFKSGGPCTYVISEIDNADKRSSDLYVCTSLVAVGKSIKTGENISFVTHQPFLSFKEKESFTNDLEEQLFEIKDECLPNTIDAIIVGGEYFIYTDFLKKKGYKGGYKDSVEFLGENVKKILHFKPMIVNGQKKSSLHGDSIYFDNENRRLYLFRPNITNTGSFLPNDIEEYIESKSKNNGDFSGV